MVSTLLAFGIPESFQSLLWQLLLGKASDSSLAFSSPKITMHYNIPLVKPPPRHDV
jgi:hypothetical protein